MTHPRTKARVAAVAAALVVLTGCDGGVPSPGTSNVAVDTPELREQKAAAGIEDCVPGTGDGDLPDLTLPCLGGGPDVELSTLQGPMLVNLWYSGCAPCREEMPLLQQLHETGEVQVLGLDVETEPGAAIAFAQSIGATYPQVADPGKAVFESGLRLVQAYPQTLFVDADGKVTHTEAGEISSYDELLDLIETHLGVDAR